MHLDGYFFTLANGGATVEEEVGTRESEGEKAGSREGEERERERETVGGGGKRWRETQGVD